MLRTTLAGSIVLLCSAVGRAEAPSDGVPDVRSAVRATVQRLVDAQNQGDETAVTASRDELAIPKLREWFGSTFTLGLPEDSQKALDANAANVWRSLDAATRVPKGSTIKDVQRYEKASEAPAGSAARVFLRLMKRPAPIYTVELAREDKISTVGCFLIVAGRVRYLSDTYAELLCDGTACKKALKQLGAAVYEFEEKNKRFPIDLAEATGKAPPECRFGPPDARGYLYVYPVLGDAASPDAILAFDPEAHPDDRRVVLFMSGRVDVMAEDAFRTTLAGQLEKSRPLVESRLKEAREGKVAAGEDAKKKVAALEATLKFADGLKPAK